MLRMHRPLVGGHRPPLLVAAPRPLTAQNVGATFEQQLVDGYIELRLQRRSWCRQSGITFEAWITYDETTIGTELALPDGDAPGQQRRRQREHVPARRRPQHQRRAQC
jgi:hypothetical protein